MRARSRLDLAPRTCIGCGEHSRHIRHGLPIEIATTVMSTGEHCNEERALFRFVHSTSSKTFGSSASRSRTCFRDAPFSNTRAERR